MYSFSLYTVLDSNLLGLEKLHFVCWTVCILCATDVQDLCHHIDINC